jgi:hypothetical protein
VSGAINNDYFIFGSGRSEGNLTFTDSQNNSVTIEVRGALQTGFSSLPQQFAYRVTSGTGAWANISNQGSLTLTLQSSHPVMTAIDGSVTTLAKDLVGTFGEQGTFTLSISASSDGVDPSIWNDPPTDPGLFPLEPVDIFPIEIGIDPIVDPIGIDPVFFIDRALPAESLLATTFSAPITAVSSEPAVSFALARGVDLVSR